MSKNGVRLAVDFTINDGKTAEFQAIAGKMIAGSQQEPGTLAFEFYLSRDGKRCRLVETYLDADALVAHFNGPVVKDLVPKLLETSSLTRFEVYGDPGPKATQMLLGFGAEIFDYWGGLSR